ncbi:hypothetical protein [Nocardioides sp.]|uniref:DUF7507 domain-containing protein n=1 Tax=Nocardioides sp. TaxID=35761 RepID=UPI003515BB5A
MATCLVAGTLALVAPAPAQATGVSSFTCDTVYSVAGTAPHGITKLDAVNGTLTSNGQFNQGDGVAVNALALPSGGGRYIWGFNRTANKVLRFDATSGSTQTYSVPDNSLAGNVIAGAINPSTGIYYYAASSTGVWTVFAFNTATQTAIGQVATISGDALDGNGDMAFDASGNLFLTTNANASAQGSLARVDGSLPTTAGSESLTVTGLATLPGDSGQYASLAFGPDGLIVVGTSTGRVLRLNPTTGAQVSSITVSSSLADMASCSLPSSATVRVNLPDGRFAGTDQFKVTLTGGGVTSGNSGTTAGTDTGLQNQSGEQAGPVLTQRSTTYTITQTAANGTNLANYTTTWTCTRSSDGSTIASGTGSSGTFTTPATASDVVCTFTNTPLRPAIDLVKTGSAITDVDGNGPDAGDTITYSFKVTNTGTVALNTVAVTDTKVGTVTCPATTLAVGASMTCTPKTYTLTQAEVDAGTVVNNATATGKAPSGVIVTDADTVTTPVPAAPAILLDKTASKTADTNSSGQEDAGDTITYSFKVTNTGNVTLQPVTVADPKLGAITCPTTALAPGASLTCSTRAYVLQQSDVDAGRTVNTATATGTAPGGTKVTDDDTETVTVPQSANISLRKSAGAVTDTDGNGVDAGDTITYTFTVTNTGNVSLDPVTVSDPKVGTITCPTGALAPGQSRACTPKTYALTQADLNAGKVDNTATATGTTPGGGTVTDTDSVTTPVEQRAALVLDKGSSAIADTNGDGQADAGDTGTYTFKVTNTGTVALNPVTVADPKVGPVTCPTGALAPGASVNCTPKAYVLTQADVDAGKVDNTATATGTTPGGAKVTDDDTETRTVPAAPAIRLVKSAGAIVDADGNGQDPGDTITYSFTVTNTGNVTLQPVTVADPKVGPVTCPTTALAPGASLTCSTATYTLTAGDIDAGRVDNTATATGKAPNGATVTDDDSTRTPITTRPALALDKQAGPVVDANSSGVQDAGDTITYSFTVTNTGTVTLDPVVVSDPKIGAVVCPAGALAPTASVTCTPKLYTLTQDDVDARRVDNTATATGTPPSGPAVTSTDSTTTPITPAAANLVLEKTVDKASPRVGDQVVYTLTVRNTGATAAQDVRITDTLPTGVTLVAADPACTVAGGANLTCALGTLAPGGSASVTVTATVDPLPGGVAAATHDLDVQKVEAQLDLEAGQTRTVSVTCAPGYLVTDGAGRADAVDQGTGTLGDVVVLASEATAPDTWSVTAANRATGRAQAKVFAVCVRQATSSNAGHAHDVVVGAPVSDTVALPTGRTDVTLVCAPGRVPMTPGYRFDGTAVVEASFPVGDDGWRFGVRTGPGADAATSATFTLGCLDRQLGEAAGHRHDLPLSEVRSTVVVPAGTVLEVELSCADDAKGIVAGWDLEPGLLHLGNDPRPKIRVFKLSNPTGAPLQASLYLRCLGTRTAGAVTGVVTNTATATTASPETSTVDNTDGATFTVDTTAAPGPVASPAAPVVVVTPKGVAAKVTCAAGARCRGTAVLSVVGKQRLAGDVVRKGVVLAKARYTVRGGDVVKVVLTPTRAGRRYLDARGLTRARLDLGEISKVVTVRR